MRALAQYVMRGPMQAGGVAAVATALPLLFWIGAAVIGLVILRLGIRQGLNIGLWAVLPALGWATFGQDPTALVVLLQVMLMASILRTSLSWERALLSGAFLMILTGLMMPLMYPCRTSCRRISASTLPRNRTPWGQTTAIRPLDFKDATMCWMNAKSP